MGRLRKRLSDMTAAVDQALGALRDGRVIDAYHRLSPLTDPRRIRNPRCYGCGKRIGYTGKWYCSTCEGKKKNAPESPEAVAAAPPSAATPGETAESKGGERQGEEKTSARRQNIAAGFHDEDGVFHPIRASHDYDPARVGEKRRRRTRASRGRRRR